MIYEYTKKNLTEMRKIDKSTIIIQEFNPFFQKLKD